MQNDNTIFEWSVTNRERIDYEFFYDPWKSGRGGAMDITIFVAAPAIMMVAGDNLFYASVLFIFLIFIFLFAVKIKKENVKYDDRVAEEYKIMEEGIEIYHIDSGERKHIGWEDIRSRLLFSRLPFYSFLKKLPWFDKSGNAIIIGWGDMPLRKTPLIINDGQEEAIYKFMLKKLEAIDTPAKRFNQFINHPENKVWVSVILLTIIFLCALVSFGPLFL